MKPSGPDTFGAYSSLKTLPIYSIVFSLFQVFLSVFKKSLPELVIIFSISRNLSILPRVLNIFALGQRLCFY